MRQEISGTTSFICRYLAIWPSGGLWIKRLLDDIGERDPLISVRGVGSIVKDRHRDNNVD